ncbi:putative insulin-induced protein family [Septoria linicola]|nr:putative insulin-induced protein family [Septoria linicola]
MSHPAPHPDDDDGFVQLKPQPRNRRAFELPTPSESEPSSPSDANSPTDLRMSDAGGGRQKEANGEEPPTRNRSFLNLTTSTLFGIYQDNGFETASQQPTPFGNGAQTPAESRHASFDWARINLPSNAFERRSPNGQTIRRKSFNPQLQKRYTKPATGVKSFLPVVGRVTALFSVGILYGLLISHLHDRQQLVPVKVNLDRERWSYLATWGFIAVFLGQALPYVDSLWTSDDDALDDEQLDHQPRGRNQQDWLNIVRSIGAFVGIAFAIRKLPWQSTLQLSLTLALANPAVWYLIDRSPPGFILSTIVSITGTGLLLVANPALVPAPGPAQVFHEQVGRHAGSGVVNGSLHALRDEDYVFGIFSQESVGVATWIASVLFVSSVCFGNIGRRLAGSEKQ